jgi:hypothetical protein
MAKKIVLPVLLAALMAFAASPAMAQSPLNVDAQAAQGFAAPGNNQAANILVVVTNPLTGAAVTNLVQSDFSIINHFGIPGQVCGFSNNIVTFHNIGTGGLPDTGQTYTHQPASCMCVGPRRIFRAAIMFNGTNLKTRLYSLPGHLTCVVNRCPDRKGGQEAG